MIQLQTIIPVPIPIDTDEEGYTIVQIIARNEKILPQDIFWLGYLSSRQ